MGAYGPRGFSPGRIAETLISLLLYLFCHRTLSAAHGGVQDERLQESETGVVAVIPPQSTRCHVRRVCLSSLNEAGPKCGGRVALGGGGGLRCARRGMLF